MTLKRLLAVLALASVACTRETPADRRPLFREAAAEAGLDFHHSSGAAGEFYIPEIMGAGVAVLDYDNDGDLDVYLVQGIALDPSKKPLLAPPPGWKPGNRLFRNELVPSGRLRFTDVTAASGAGHIGHGMGVATGDFNNDGFVDLYVTNFGGNVLYRNNGNGTFTDITAKAGVDDPLWSTSSSFFDYDRDGNLDLFVLNYVDFTVKGNKRCQGPTGEPDYCTPAAYRPVKARLFRNDGGERFADVTSSSGIGSKPGPGLGVAAADLDGDGWPDLYVANDGAANHLWRNGRDGTFRESALESGVAYSEDGIARAGMGVTAGDFDNDGDDDLFVVNLMREGATLYRNDVPRGFTDATLRSGLGTLTFPSTGFGVEWFDYDKDGWLDLFVANGAVTILESLRGNPYPFHQKNSLFHHEGEGQRFRDATADGGPALDIAEVSRGAAFGDIDNDGDVDIVVSNNNGPVRLLLNEAGAGRHWLQVQLQGARSNRQAIGARVGLRRDGKKTLWRRAHTDSSYLSASDPRVHFGLGPDGSAAGIEVEWPDGSKESWPVAGVDRLVGLRQGMGRRE